MRAWARNLCRRSHEAKTEAMRASAKNLRRRSQAPTLFNTLLSALSGARKYQPEPRSWGETSGEHPNRSTPGATNDSIPSCRPSLGLGNTSLSRDPEGQVWGITGRSMIQTAPAGPLWGSEIPARAEVLEGDAWRALKSVSYVVRP